MSAPAVFLIRHGWAVAVLALLASVSLGAADPIAAAVDADVASEVQHAAAMVKAQQKTERAKQLGGPVSMSRIRSVAAWLLSSFLALILAALWHAGLQGSPPPPF